MAKYSIRISTVIVDDEDQYGNSEVITCIYVIEAGSMESAMGKARTYAYFQMDDEGCDYIEAIEIRRCADA